MNVSVGVLCVWVCGCVGELLNVCVCVLCVWMCWCVSECVCVGVRVWMNKLVCVNV